MSPNRTLVLVGEGLVELSLDRSNGPVTLGYGGDAANIAVMAARLEAHARLAGRVGDDVLGARLLAFWHRSGVDVTHVTLDHEAATGLYVNEVGANLSHRFTYLRNGSAGSRWGSNALDVRLLEGAALLVVTGVTLAASDSAAAGVLAAIELARALSIKVACVVNYRSGLGPDTSVLAAVARSSEIVFASAEDALAVFGTARVEDLHGFLSQTRELVLTDGDRDAIVSHSGALVRQPVPRVPVRNAAGAGDALAGAYLAARTHHRLAPDRALAWGVAAASLSVQQSGCASSYPTLKQTRDQLLRLASPLT